MTAKLRAQPVVRLRDLPRYLGIGRTTVRRMIDEGKLTPFNLSGRRAMVVLESQVAELQATALASAKVKQERRKAKAERERNDAS
jgi:excisionase family DNA binding protein